MPLICKDDPIRHEKYCSYDQPSKEDLFAEYKRVEKLYLGFATVYQLPPNEAKVDPLKLGRVLVRVDQRSVYYKIFHNNTYLNEVRRTALLAYWIIKYKPFSFHVQNESDYRNHMMVNEGFALYLILGMISKLIFNGAKAQKLQLSTDYLKRIYHTFREDDISKESIIILADSLLEGSKLVPIAKPTP